MAHDEQLDTLPGADEEYQNPFATYEGEELRATFTGCATRADYGVPRSPVLAEIEEIEIQSLEILGLEIDPAQLPGPLVARVLALANELDFDC